MAKAESSCVIWSRGIFRHAQSVIFALPHMVFTMASEQSEVSIFLRFLSFEGLSYIPEC